MMKKLSSYILLLSAFMIAGGYYLYLTFSGRITPNALSTAVIELARPYPTLTGPKTISLSCDYHGQSLSLDETLYSSLADYYRSDPAKKSAYYHDQNEKFVYSYKQDTTVSSLTTKIKRLATEKGLDTDQTLDLTSCFLQSIPYDDAKAAKILSPDYYKLPADQLIPRYPYETLYDNKGICTDKSFLGVAVFRELGYGTSLLTFDSQRHMSIGIAAAEGFGDFGTKYAIMELTGKNFLVGDIPEISSDAGIAVGGVQAIPNVTTDTVVTDTKKEGLTTLARAIPISEGLSYTRIAEREALKTEIESTKAKVEASQTTYLAQKTALTDAEQALKTAEATYKSDPSNSTYSAYTAVYNRYSKVYAQAKQAVDSYNRVVNQYNALVSKYREF